MKFDIEDLHKSACCLLPCRWPDGQASPKPAPGQVGSSPKIRPKAATGGSVSVRENDFTEICAPFVQACEIGCRPAPIGNRPYRRLLACVAAVQVREQYTSPRRIRISTSSDRRLRFTNCKGQGTLITMVRNLFLLALLLLGFPLGCQAPSAGISTSTTPA